MTLCKTFSNIRISDIIISCLCLIGIVYGFCYDIRMLFPAIVLCVWFSIKILKYIYPDNYKAKPIDHRTKEEKFEAVFNSQGIITYREDGTHVSVENGPNFRWDEIRRIIALKRDLLVQDHIYLSVELGEDQGFTIHETTDGWDQFIKKMGQSLEIDQNWHEKVMLTPFESSETLVYQNPSLQKN